MLNYRMLTPGPTPVPESSLQKLGRQVRHHRTADFTAVLERVTQNLKQVFKTERSSIAVLQGSGTSAMDACVSNVIVPGDVAQGSSPIPQFKIINSSALSFLYGPALTSIHEYWKNHTCD